VTHDKDDSMWQFHDGFEVNVEDSMIVALKEIISIDKTINEIYNLPLGWYAWRKDSNEDWEKGELE